MSYKVTFKFEVGEREPEVHEAEEGESVLDIALDNDIDLHHNCGGVRACSTCHIYVDEGMDHLPEITDEEEDFIDRAVNPKLNSRLACQCEIVDGDVEVTIPDQSVHLGH